MGKKVLYLILGAALIAMAVLSLTVDGAAYLFCGIGLLLFGAGKMVNWGMRRKSGTASLWELILGIIAFSGGVLMLFGNQIGDFALINLLIILSIYLMVIGVFEILGAIMYRKAMTTADLGVQAPGSVSSMVIGVIMIVVGVLGIIFPIFASVVVGLMMVGGMLVMGIKLIWMARSAGVLEASDE
jgi:uncharacterized membrane protein HdeD (DUF308 family)